MSDIHDTLQQLDRRLSDLKRELASIGQQPHEGVSGPGPPAAQPGSRAAASPSGSPPRPETHQRASYAAADLPASVPGYLPPPPPRYDVPGTGLPPAASLATAAAGSGALPHEIVARAEAEAARLLTHAHERLDELKAQIEQLLGLRERLLRSARDLVRQYEEEVSHLELRYPVTSVAAEIARQPPPLGSASAPPPPGFSGSPASPPRPAYRTASPASPSHFSAPASPAPGEPSAAPGLGEAGGSPGFAEAAGAPGFGEAGGAAGSESAPFPRPAQYEGVVTVIVPWVSRLQTIQVLEDSLSRVRGARPAYVRGYHQGEVRFELDLREAVDLIGELNRVLPYAFAIESARQDEIVIRLERAEGSGGGGVS